MGDIKLNFTALGHVPGNTTIRWKYNGLDIPALNDLTQIPNEPWGNSSAGEYEAVVTIFDSAGRGRAKTTNKFAVGTPVFYDPPGQMAMPVVVEIAPTQFIVALPATDPPDNGTPIGDYDLRYSTNELTWTQVDDFATPQNRAQYTATGLTPNQGYFVQVRAGNVHGPGEWSASTLIYTPPLPVVPEAPAAFTAENWKVEDTASDGVLKFTFGPVIPFDGNSPAANIHIFKNGSATPIPTGLTGAGEYFLTGQANGVAANFRVALVNAAGFTGALSDSKTQTPTAPAPGVTPGTQTFKVGALTRANAGRIRPLNNLRQPVAITAVNPVPISGALLGYTPTVYDGGLAFTTIGCPAGAVTLRCTLVGGATVDVTCDPTGGANFYFVASWAEHLAAISANGTTGGRTIQWREGDFDIGTGDFVGPRTYTGGNLTIKGSDYTHPEEYWGTRLNGSVTFTGCRNVDTRDISIGDIDSTGTDASQIVKFNGKCVNVNFYRCEIYSRIDPTYLPGTDTWLVPDLGGALGFQAKSSGTYGMGWSGTIEECYVHHCRDFCKINLCPEGGVYFICNKSHLNYGDAYKISGAAEGVDVPVVGMFNTHYEHFRLNSGPDSSKWTHIDQMWQWAGSGTYNNRTAKKNVKLIMNMWFASDSVFYKGMQGATAFDDGDGTINSTKFPVMFDSPEVVGNLAPFARHHCTMESFNGIFAFNTMVSPSSDYPLPNQPYLAGFDTGITFPQQAYAPNRFFCNITEQNGPQGENKNNLVLGLKGATRAFSTVFEGPSFTGAPNDPAAVKARWTPITKTRGAVSNIGTYGTPRVKSTWAYNEALMLSQLAVHYP